MACRNKEEACVLDAQCGDLDSPASRRTIRELRSMTARVQISYTANYAVCNCGNLVRCALEAGVSAGSYFQDMSLLCIAAESPLKALLAGGADPNARDRVGNMALIKSIGRKQGSSCCRALLDVSDLSLTNGLGFNALHACVAVANQECFELVLPCVNDVDARTMPGVDEHGAPLAQSSGRTALMMACERGHHDMVKALLKCGASRTATDSAGFRPAHFAAKNGQLSYLNLILGKEGRYKLSLEQVNESITDGWTALHAAAFFGQAKCCGLLIAAGARLDVRLPEGATPLMLAQQQHPANTALLDVLAGRGPTLLPGTCCDRCGATSGADGRSVKICNGCHSARFCSSACLTAA